MDPDRRDALRALLDAAEVEALDLGASAVEYLGMSGNPYASVFADAGYLRLPARSREAVAKLILMPRLGSEGEEFAELRAPGVRMLITAGDFGELV